MKKCYILDNSRGFIFYGDLDENLSQVNGYNFYEVPESIKGRPLKVINGIVTVDFKKEYNDKIEYQKKAFREFRNDILKKIQYATLLGQTTTVADLTDKLNDELQAYENRVLAITLETE